MKTTTPICMIAMISACLFAATTHGATIATWTTPTIDDGDLEGAAVSNATNVVDSVQGSGLFPATNNANGVDWVNSESPAITNGEIVYGTASGAVDDTNDLADAIADDQYYQFSFEVAGLGAGETLTLDAFNYSSRRNSNSDQRSGWDESQLTWRVNDLSFSTGDAAGGINNDPDVGDIDTFSVTTALPTGLVNGDVVNFRLYAWGSDADGEGTNFHSATRIGGISVQGTVVVPAPAALPAGLGLLLTVAARRRR